MSQLTSMCMHADDGITTTFASNAEVPVSIGDQILTPTWLELILRPPLQRCELLPE